MATLTAAERALLQYIHDHPGEDWQWSLGQERYWSGNIPPKERSRHMQWCKRFQSRGLIEPWRHGDRVTRKGAALLAANA